jgi:hypothetical protein
MTLGHVTLRPNIRIASFQYPEVVYNHYHYRHSVNDHNAKRHAPISLEVVWATTRWSYRVFAFLLGISEVNIFLADNFFFFAGHSGMLAFRKELVEALIFNKYVIDVDDSPSKCTRK